MKKLKFAVLSCIILLTLLVSSFYFDFYQAKASPPLPVPNYKHLSFEAVSNQEIIHRYEVDGVATTHSLKPPYVVPSSSFAADAGQGEHLVYETGYKDLYFAVDLSNFLAAGTYKKDSNNKLKLVYYMDYSEVTQDFPQITNLADQKYITTLCAISDRAYNTKINNMTPDTLPSKNLPVDKIKVTVKYNQDSDGYKNLKPEHLARASLGLPPENMPCYLYYAPETSIYFSHAVVKKANIDSNGNLDFGTIQAHKGWYKAICQFHIMTPNVTGGSEKAFFDWDQSWYEAGFYTGVSAWASATIGNIENIAGTIASWIDRVPSTPSATGYLRDNYWSSYSVHVSDLDATSSIALQDMEMKNETELNNLLTALGNKDIGGICSSGKSDITSLVREGVCGMLTLVKGWADATFKWASGWMKTMIGVTSTGQPEDIKEPTFKEPDATSPSGTGSQP